MSLCIASINSGSNGNCYYVGNNEDAVLVDAGISCREIEQRMHRLGLPIKKLRAIFISHEHTDHIRGASVFSTKHKIPVFITQATLRNSRMKILPTLICRFEPEKPEKLGSLSIRAFSKPHDAADPHSFVVSSNDVNVGVFTDIGGNCNELNHYFRDCQAVFLESNYDDEMLESGPYPYHLKNRIRGGQGHLSNRQALQILLNHRSSKLSHLILSHLSAQNNNPELVANLFAPYVTDIDMLVASRFAESKVFEIKNGQPKVEIASVAPFIESNFGF